MEYARTISLDRQLTWREQDIDAFPMGLDELLVANAEFDSGPDLSPDTIEKAEALTIRRPMNREAVFKYFGLMLGTFPPAAFFVPFLIAKGKPENLPLVFVILFLANATTALVGFKFGRATAKMVESAAKIPLIPRIPLIVLIGTLWGVAAGGLGGAFIFVIGAFFGAAIGGVVGAIALSAFMVPYSLVKRDGTIGLSHFLPMSAGITLVICSFILRFLLR